MKQRPVPEAQRQAGSSADQKDYIGGGDDGSSELSDKGDSITRARIVGAR